MASKKEIGFSTRIKGVCGSCDETAKMRCTTCSEVLCGDCSMKHRSETRTKDHVITRIETGDVQGKTRKECDGGHGVDFNEPQNEEPQNTGKGKKSHENLGAIMDRLVDDVGQDNIEYVTNALKLMHAQPTDNLTSNKLKMEDLDSDPNAIKLAEGRYYFKNKEIGSGGFGTVFKGTSGGIGAMHTVAVKQIKFRDQDQSLKKEMKEAKLLQNIASENIPHVVRYYELVQKDSHLFIFTELYDGTLEDYVKPGNECLRRSFSATVVNRCLVEGLKCLHAKGVVHRDLKPTNIYIGLNEHKTEIIKVAIGDFGSAKLCQMKYDKYFSCTMSDTPGTLGYMAPEVLKQVEKKKFTFESDIFSLGLIYYFTISNGKHPFGESGFDQQCGIKYKEEPNLKDASIEYKSLIRQMIQTDIKNRVSAEAVLSHPALWPSEQILNYFKESSSFLEKKSDKALMLEGKLVSSEIIRSQGWMAELPVTLRDNLYSRSDRYDEYNVISLLTAIRNTEHNIESYPGLEGGPDHRVTIWLKACPELTLCVYDAFKEIDYRDTKQTEVVKEKEQTSNKTDNEQTEVNTAVYQISDESDSFDLK